MASVNVDSEFYLQRRMWLLSEHAFRLYFCAVLATKRHGVSYLPDEDVRRLVRNFRRKAVSELEDNRLFVREGRGVHVRNVIAPRDRRPFIPKRIRDEVYMRDGHACVICGAHERLSLDHIVPYSAGGPDTVDNLRTLCHWCNARRGAALLTDEQLKELA